MLSLLRAVLASGILLGISFLHGQEQILYQAEPAPEFVSGTVVELPPGKIVVNRAVLGKPAENRTFLIDGQTKIEGRLRQRARVTVGFRASDEGDVAVRIIVRGSQATEQPKD